MERFEAHLRERIYLDNQGETYAKEMAEIMNKVKAQYQVRLQSNAYVNNELKSKSR